MNQLDNSTKFSAVFGMVLSIFVNIQTEDLIKTVLLAASGGISSFLATLLVKIFYKKHKKQVPEIKVVVTLEQMSLSYF